jgi:hypothetical protein
VRKSNALCGVTDNGEQLAVTITLGAITRLWVYADSHIAHDNTLAITLDEINELVGVEGFAQALPVEWLVVIDPDHVELPDFLQHNGTSAKERSDNARRQAQYRQRHRSPNVTGESRVTNGSNDARPDQTRPDHIQDATPPKQLARAPTASELAQGRAALGEGHLEEDEIKGAYPKFSGRQDWLTPLHLISGIVERGEATWAQLLEAVTRYAAFVAAGGVSGTQYVLTPAKFFGAADKPWSQDWDPPQSKAAKPDPGAERKARDAAELQALVDGRAARGLLDFREPYEIDNAGTYGTALRQEEIRRRGLKSAPTPLSVITSKLVAEKGINHG